LYFDEGKYQDGNKSLLWRNSVGHCSSMKKGVEADTFFRYLKKKL
jgi:hypothetical protein